MKELIQLYWTFFKMGAVNFGGGYAMLPLLQREIVEKNGWATDDEISDYYAVGQCTPGVISVNVSTFIGYKRKGILGGILATLGFLTPSILIIIVIATILHNFQDNKYVIGAFEGIRVCVCVLMISALYKLLKNSVKDLFTIIVFVSILLLSIFTDISPILFIILASIAGLVYGSIKEKKEEKTNDLP